MKTLFRTSNSRIIERQVEDLAHKIRLCSDSKIKSEAEKLIKSANFFNYISRIIRAEHLLDTVNTANGNYCTLYNEWTPYDVCKKLPKYFDSLPKDNQETVKNVRYSVPRCLRMFYKEKYYDDTAKLSSLKRYISKYSDDKEIIDYLYNEYYFKNIKNEDFANFLHKIDKDFGVKLFADKPLDKSTQLYVYDELSNFKQAANGAVVFPPLIDISDFDYSRAQNFEGISVRGFFHEPVYYGKRIQIKNSYLKSYQGLRHELVHWFDKKIKQTLIGVKRAEISEEEISEMQKANVKNVLYAYTNNNEFKAVWGQGSISKYSDKFKHKMIKLGLPKWITKLKDVSLKKYLDKYITDDRSKEIFTKIEKNYNGNVPESVISAIIDNPENIEVYSKILEIKNKKTGVSTYEDYLLDISKLEDEKFDYLQKFADLELRIKLTEKEFNEEKQVNPNITEPFLDVAPYYFALLFDNLSIEQIDKIYKRVAACKTKQEYVKLIDVLIKYNQLVDKIKKKK